VIAMSDFHVDRVEQECTHSNITLERLTNPSRRWNLTNALL